MCGCATATSPHGQPLIKTAPTAHYPCLACSPDCCTPPILNSAPCRSGRRGRVSTIGWLPPTPGFSVWQCCMKRAGFNALKKTDTCLVSYPLASSLTLSLFTVLFLSFFSRFRYQSYYCSCYVCACACACACVCVCECECVCVFVCSAAFWSSL